MTPESPAKKAYRRRYWQRPEVKERKRAAMREYRQSEKGKEAYAHYRQKPETKAKRRVYERDRRRRRH